MVPIHQEAADAIRLVQQQRRREADRCVYDADLGQRVRYLFVHQGRLASPDYLDELGEPHLSDDDIERTELGRGGRSRQLVFAGNPSQHHIDALRALLEGVKGRLPFCGGTKKLSINSL